MVQYLLVKSSYGLHCKHRRTGARIFFNLKTEQDYFCSQTRDPYFFSVEGIWGGVSVNLGTNVNAYG